MNKDLPEALKQTTKLSIHEAADYLGVSTKTLRRWESQGILTPERTPGNQRRYSLIQLQTFDLSQSKSKPLKQRQ
jgi:excisionase family DNA binding protein